MEPHHNNLHHATLISLPQALPADKVKTARSLARHRQALPV
jgi:hypothetical protein